MPSSRKMLQAVVTGPGEARVEWSRVEIALAGRAKGNSLEP